MVRRDTSRDPIPPPKRVAPPEERRRGNSQRQSVGLTIILSLAAGFAIGHMGEYTHWWQWVCALVIIGVFLHRFLENEV